MIIRTEKAENQASGYCKSDNVTTELRQSFSQYITDLQEKLLQGEAQEKIAIGAEEYTDDQWKELLESFDSVQKEITAAMRERHQQVMQQTEARKEEQEEQRT
ncbi:MAG: hypothetical protein ACI4DN_09345 [Lachnospiraceae bacterium]